jgi:hypothetical protein
MKTSNSLLLGRQVLTLAFTGFAALLIAGAIGCNSDSSVPVSAPPPPMDPATASTDADPSGAPTSSEAPE